MQHLLDILRAEPVIAVGAIAFVLALLCIALATRVERLQDRLHTARAAAEDAAKAASLAAPGGIDSEVVADILQAGERPTLDSVYAAMQQRGGQRAR